MDRNRKTYVKPALSSEQFVPQTYVAACREGGVVYKFKCDAGGGVYGKVYEESNGETGLQEGLGLGILGDRKLTNSYHACQKTHEASSADEFLTGYYVPDRGQTIPVIIWRGEDGRNVHCTTNLDISTWEKTMS